MSSSQAVAEDGRRPSGTRPRATTLIAKSRRKSATVRKVTLVAVAIADSLVSSAAEGQQVARVAWIR
jgi:hypothetical protein